MDNGKRKVVTAQMKPRERHKWTAKTPHRRRFKWDKRLLRRSVPLAAVFLCIGYYFFPGGLTHSGLSVNCFMDCIKGHIKMLCHILHGYL